MTKKLIGLTILIISVFIHSMVFATPSTTYWTPATTDIQPYGVLHIGNDDYFTVFRNGDKGAGAFPNDFGLTLGILPFEKLQMEIGVDLLEPSLDPDTASDNPLFFNAKIGTPEGSLFSGSPALNLGIFNVGTKSKVTNQNVVDFLVGKTIPGIGRLFAGLYYGNPATLLDKDGMRENTGFMVGFDHGFLPTRDAKGNEYNKLVLAADYASGKNAIGGGGAGLYYYFTKDISLLTGPVWFNEEAINGKWKWTIQVDINLDIFSK